MHMNKNMLARVIGLILVAAICCAMILVAPATENRTEGGHAIEADAVVSSHDSAEETLSLSPLAITLCVGEIGNIQYNFTGTGTLNWESSDPSVATVSNGKVIAKEAGTTSITMSDGDKSTNCVVTVVNAKPAPGVKMSLNRTSLILGVGESANLKYSYNGTKALTWSSSNTTVATVSDGKVVAKAVGTAVVTLSDGVVNSQCVISVKNAAPFDAEESLSISTEALKLEVGNTYTLATTYTGSKSLVWTSSNKSVVTVSGGKVTAKGVGSANVVVTDGKKTATCVVTVAEASKPAESIKVTYTDAPLFDGVEKVVGDYLNFDVCVKPDGAPREIIVTSSNSSVVAVSGVTNSGNTTKSIKLDFKSDGSATVTIRSADGCAAKSYAINVKDEYNCYSGSGQLSPEEWADCCTQVMVENGFSKRTDLSSYRVLTLSNEELTWDSAKALGEGCVHSWWELGEDCGWITYEGMDEKGNHVFYVRYSDKADPANALLFLSDVYGGEEPVLRLSHSVLELPLNGPLGWLFPLNADAPLDLQWSTEDSSVVEVTRGLITPKAVGTTVITCTDGVSTASCKVVVTAEADKEYYLALPVRELSASVGDSGTVKYTYTGPGTIAAFSNNQQVVQVKDGRYTAVAPGTAVITVTDGIRISQFIINVTESSYKA